MITLILFILCLVCMLFYCCVLGNYIGTAIGRFLGRAVVAYIYGVDVILNGSEPVNIKGRLAWRILKATGG